MLFQNPVMVLTKVHLNRIISYEWQIKSFQYRGNVSPEIMLINFCILRIGNPSFTGAVDIHQRWPAL